MKGMILAGGRGSRLQPCTNIISKALLPVYNRPMIYYPLNSLLQAGIKDILFIVSPYHAEDFFELLGDGSQYDARFSYKIQKEPRGIAEAFIIGKEFIGDDNITMILADNIFVDDISEEIANFKKGGKIFVKSVPDPERFGVVEINKDGQAITIEEKPKNPKSNLAITGIYIYDSRVTEIATSVQPSERGELEVTDLHRWYMDKGELEVTMIYKEWIDAGTFESLYAAQTLSRDKLQDKMII